MMDFSDNEHNLAELVFLGATESDPEQSCNEDVIAALTRWRDRPDHLSSGSNLFRMEGCANFTINYEGNVEEYWPNESENNLCETLVREFLFQHGICSLTDERVRLVQVKYNIMALAGDEYLLVCPYLTAAGNISGIVVVCVTKMRRQITRQAS